MIKMLRNLIKLAKYGPSALVVPRKSDGVEGCYVAAIIRKGDGGVWAVERNIDAAYMKQQSDAYARENTFIRWMALMPDPASHTWRRGE